VSTDPWRLLDLRRNFATLPWILLSRGITADEKGGEGEKTVQITGGRPPGESPVDSIITCRLFKLILLDQAQSHSEPDSQSLRFSVKIFSWYVVVGEPEELFSSGSEPAFGVLVWHAGPPCRMQTLVSNLAVLPGNKRSCNVNDTLQFMYYNYGDA